jgi:uncharacterized protein (DUF433 family)
MSTATDAIYHCDPEIMGGVPVFVGTRVPVQALWDYLGHGRPLQEFLEDFPTVKREQAVATIAVAAELIKNASAS